MAVVKEEEIARLMKVTNSTREEVLDMLDCDKRIDRGEKLFELDSKEHMFDESFFIEAR